MVVQKVCDWQSIVVFILRRSDKGWVMKADMDSRPGRWTCTHHALCARHHAEGRLQRVAVAALRVLGRVRARPHHRVAAVEEVRHGCAAVALHPLGCHPVHESTTLGYVCAHQSHIRNTAAHRRCWLYKEAN